MSDNNCSVFLSARGSSQTMSTIGSVRVSAALDVSESSFAKNVRETFEAPNYNENPVRAVNFRKCPRSMNKVLTWYIENGSM